MSAGTGRPGPSGRSLAEQLQSLKQRSGRSYEALANRTGLSRSTIHRYCQGRSLPGTFGAVELLARVCGAQETEVDRLYRAWRRAVTEQEAACRQEAASQGDGDDGREGPGSEHGSGNGNSAASGGRCSCGAAGPGSGAEPGTNFGAASGADSGAGFADRVGEPAGREGRGVPDVPDGSDGPDERGGRETGSGQGGGRGDREDPHDGHGADDAPGSAEAPAGRPLVPLRAYVWLQTAALLFAFVVTSAATAAPYLGGDLDQAAGDSKPGGGTAGTQQVTGPFWSVSPRGLPPRFFGQTLNSDTGSMPGFGTDAVRLWNSETRWGSIERRRGRYDWKTLDRLVEAAERKGLPVLFTFGGTPLWAAEDGRRSGFRDSLASPPDDLDDWDRFVERVAERYRGRIEAYELWDYPNDRGHYAGSYSTLAEMVERASRIIERKDPEAAVACPSFGKLWSARGRRALVEFVKTGAYEHCDAAALKMPPRKAEGRPEEFIEIAHTAHAIFHEHGRANIPLWNTGPDIDVAVAPRLDERRARDYAVRFYLAGLYARPYGVKRMYFYAWGSSHDVPVVVEPVDGPPTEAGLRMGRLRAWLEDARIAACGSGRQMGLEPGAYTCRFERDGELLRVCWTTRGTAGLTLEQGAYRLRHMDGSTERVRGGERIAFGEEPVLIEHR